MNYTVETNGIIQMKTMNDNIIKKLIIEGRVEDMKAKYVDNPDLLPIKKLSNIKFDRLVKGDPSGNQKYLEWMIKQVISGDIIGVTTSYILKLVSEFHEKQDRLTKKDLYQYSGFHELEKALKNLPPSKAELKRIQKEGSVKIYEDNKYLIVVPKTTEASCYYGQGTKWCTAAKKGNQFENYSSSGVLFYIIDKTNPGGKDENGHDFSKLAVYVPNYIIEDADENAGGLRYLDHYDIELYDATDELLEDALWSDYVVSSDDNKLKMQDAMVNYFVKHNSDESNNKTDEKLLKGIEENFNRYVPTNEFRFNSRWGSGDELGLDIIDGDEKYYIAIQIKTNKHDTVYFDLNIVDYNNPGDVLDKASVQRRVPMEIYMGKYDFDPRLIHWSVLMIKALSTSLINRYENSIKDE